MIQSNALLLDFMGVMGRKWVVPVILFLFIYEKTTFTKMKRHLRVTSRVLSKKLKLLETLGLIEKIIIDDSRKIVYTLSEKGRKISTALLDLSASLKELI